MLTMSEQNIGHYRVGLCPMPIVVRLSIARARRRMPLARRKLDTDPKAKAIEP